MQADAGLIGDCGMIYQTGLRKGLPVRYKNLWTAFYTIYSTEGLMNGLYRGAAVTVSRASLLNGAQLASYDTLKRLVATEKTNEGTLLHVCCALASGIFAQTVVMPFDGTYILCTVT
jgi:hypothetical protein